MMQRRPHCSSRFGPNLGDIMIGLEFAKAKACVLCASLLIPLRIWTRDTAHLAFGSAVHQTYKKMVRLQIRQNRFCLRERWLQQQLV